MSDKTILEQAQGKPINRQTKRLSLRKLQGLQTFAPLADCPNLEYLLLRAPGAIPPLTPLVNCNNLHTISIREETKLKSLAFVEQMPQLKKLEINKRLYELLDGLSPQIKDLKICSSTLDRLHYFRNFSNLKELELGTDAGIYTKIDDHTDFTPVKQIERLFMMSRLMTNTKSLGVLNNCRSLFIGANKKLKDLSGLEPLQKLEALVCSRTVIKDLSPISRLPLQYLSVAQTKIKHLIHLNLPQLVHLYAGNNNLKKLELNNAFPNLQLLSLSRTPVKDISQIEQMPALKYLSLWGCNDLRTFSPILTLKKLKAIDCSESAIGIKDFQQIAALPTIKKIAIYNTKISQDENLLLKAKSIAKAKGILLVHDRSGLLGFQKPYYRLMHYYLCAYQGKSNPWYKEWGIGYRI